MAHTFLCLRIHCVWATYRRRPWIDPEWQWQLYRYFDGIARRKGSVLFCAGGMPDHVHLYLSLPADLSIAQLVAALKANSSRWIHETFPRLRYFAWQQGYSAFSVSKYSEARLIAYIRNQRAHHSAKPGPKGRHPRTGRPIREDGATIWDTGFSSSHSRSTTYTFR